MSPKILVIDIETAAATVETFGLFKQNIGIGQIIDPVRVICFAAKWHGEPDKKIVFHAEWDSTHEDMISAAYELINEADFVVGWNSQGFDVKHLNAEFLKYGYKPPSPYKNVDLMLCARKNFRLMSNKLDWYAQQLGVGSKVQNGGMSLWRELARPESEKSLLKARKLMERYNRADVALTDELFVKLRPWISGVNVGLYVDSDKPVCVNCGSESLQRRGWAYLTAGKYRRFQCNDCGRWNRDAKRESTVDMRFV